MKLETFLMERFQSTWENRVDVNLSESGVDPMSVRELLDDAALGEELLDQQLLYPQTNGTLALRETLAALYDGATSEHVEVTNGGAEANFVVALHAIEPGDEVVVMLPNYMQLWGLARGFGANVRPWHLVPDDAAGRWRADLDGLEQLVGPRTKLIAICNPNNPTGGRLTTGELDGIARIAERHGAWVLADEIYRGAELDGVETPTMWGRCERVMITSGLSKAYGLPGLRIGWIVAPPERIEACWTTHDYTTIAPGVLSDRLATHALQAATRARILERTREIVRANYEVLRPWLEELGLWYLPPEAGAMLYLRYTGGANSTELVERLRTEHSVLVVPGDHYGMDGYLRIGFGGAVHELRAGLERLRTLLCEETPA